MGCLAESDLPTEDMVVLKRKKMGFLACKLKSVEIGLLVQAERA